MNIHSDIYLLVSISAFAFNKFIGRDPTEKKYFLLIHHGLWIYIAVKFFRVPNDPRISA